MVVETLDARVAIPQQINGKANSFGVLGTFSPQYPHVQLALYFNLSTRVKIFKAKWSKKKAIVIVVEKDLGQAWNGMQVRLNHIAVKGWQVRAGNNVRVVDYENTSA